MKRCQNPDCGEELEDDEKFCTECGTGVCEYKQAVTSSTVVMSCPLCGAERKYGKKGLSKFCSQCRYNYSGKFSMIIIIG